MSYLIQQAVAGANQYDGTAARGLVTWTAASGSAIAVSSLNNDETVVITALALETEEAIPAIFAFFAMPGGTTLQRATIVRPTVAGSTTAQAARGFAMLGCGLYVPRNSMGTSGTGGGALWNLIVTTTGKTQDANLIVEFTVGLKPGKMPNR